MKKEDVKKGSIYELDGVVPLKEALPLGIQHVLAMFLGNTSPLLSTEIGRASCRERV